VPFRSFAASVLLPAPGWPTIMMRSIDMAYPGDLAIHEAQKDAAS
jgi:hypothetical protein